MKNRKQKDLSMQAFDRSFKQSPLRSGRTVEAGVRSQTESPGADEFFSAAVELAELADTFFGPDKSLESFKGDFDGDCKDLLRLYDEFLNILEEELQAGTQPASISNGFDRSKRESLIRLHAAIQCNRALISSLFAAMQQVLPKRESERKVISAG
jgi:hypothetical protein